MLSPILSTLALLVLIATAVEGAEKYPTGSANVWEFVDCVRNSDGYQTAEAWQWLTGNAPTDTGAPSWKYKVVEGGSYYWEGKSTSFYDRESLRIFSLSLLPFSICSFLDRSGVHLRRRQYEPRRPARHSGHK